MNNKLIELYKKYEPLKAQYDELESLNEEIERVIKELQQKKTDVFMKMIDMSREVFDLNGQIIELEKDIKKIFNEEELKVINEVKEPVQMTYKNTDLKYLRVNQYNDEGYFIGEKERYNDKYIRHTFYDKERLVKMIKESIKEINKKDESHPFLKEISKKEYNIKHLNIMVHILINLYDTK